MATLVVGSACSDESFTPSDCDNVVLYDIRAATTVNGAVKSIKQVPLSEKDNDKVLAKGSPLSASQQRALREAEAQGCITLPNFELSLRTSSDGGANSKE